MFYLAGPPGLVAGVAKTLSDAGADPARVHCEEFAGYQRPGDVGKRAGATRMGGTDDAVGFC